MVPTTVINAAYDQFLQLSRELSASGHHEASFHGLMAAVHCAEDAGNSEQLAEVGRRLRQEREIVDAVEPPHKLSTKSSHGARSIFEMGASTTDAIIQRLANQHRMEKMRRENHRRNRR